MDKLKTMMDKGDAEESTGPSGRVTGQGSHFPKGEEQPVGATTAPQENTMTGDTLGTGAGQTHEALPTGPDPGTAAIGETSTYSSRTLRKGDPVPNIVDSRSEDPTTYRAPEHSYVSSTGVPEDGPLRAAALAFHKDKDYSTSHIPGAFPNDISAHDATTIAPPDLTTTTSPAQRSGVYGEAEKTKVPDAAAAAQYATKSAPGAQDPVSEEPRKSGTIGKILGAVGLGTAAGGAAAATSRAEEKQPHAIADTPDQPTTTTGVDSYTAPSRSGPAPTHHRKESIPTTAYPAGADSPAPINAPVGGTSALVDQDREDHTGRNVGLAAGAAGVGAGAAAYAMHDRDRDTARSDWPLRDDATAATPAAATVPASESAARTAPSSQPAEQRPLAHEAAPAAGASVVPEYSQRQDKLETQAQKDKAKQEATRAGATSMDGGASVAPEYTERQNRVSEETDRRRRNKEEEAALAGVAGAGAGAAGLHEYNQRQDRHEEEAQRQKDLAEQEAARQKQFEKDQKAAEKQAKKEEKQHQKELKKEEKQHEKELKKEEKQHQKEIAKEEKAQEKAAEKDEKQRREELEHEQKEREKAAAATAAVGAGAYEVHDKDKHPPPTTATDESGHTKLHKDPPEEKKPSLLKRIFKRRKNKDTGEEEEYEDHDNNQEPEAEHGDHHLAEAGVAAGGTGAAVAGTAAAASHEPAPAARSSYEAQSGGLQKPSYNPFSKDDPAHYAQPTASSSTAPTSGLSATEAAATHPGQSSVEPTAIDPATTTQRDVPYNPAHDPSSQNPVSDQGGNIR
ncbi:uncharacterized protein Z520_11064 [Fonsecaea multimorphosa CBS 102226]|uniref:Uncharacterized protein n=1 Tax=Fonsecaea multimorphosa CBS 102226 TaxID=1442371 RepID=A0A0D2GUJ0_9EURO|nr:uncharacterized protein Z520_11064 [Fonsecaea multimorphosa CBS 102226]KIX93210.1 hypothetical protein Z520_11064 [Fonsecaea multimorphosa CBS 102226]